jgi:hypothetical protein
MKYLDGTTWLRFAGWLLAGLVIYAVYGYRHPGLRSGEPGTGYGAIDVNRG